MPLQVVIHQMTFAPVQRHGQCPDKTNWKSPYRYRQPQEPNVRCKFSSEVHCSYTCWHKAFETPLTRQSSSGACKEQVQQA